MGITRGPPTFNTILKYSVLLATCAPPPPPPPPRLNRPKADNTPIVIFGCQMTPLTLSWPHPSRNARGAHGDASYNQIGKLGTLMVHIGVCNGGQDTCIHVPLCTLLLPLPTTTRTPSNTYHYPYYYPYSSPYLLPSQKKG